LCISGKNDPKEKGQTSNPHSEPPWRGTRMVAIELQSEYFKAKDNSPKREEKDETIETLISIKAPSVNGRQTAKESQD